jgi:hypothetical protein
MYAADARKQKPALLNQQTWRVPITGGQSRIRLTQRVRSVTRKWGDFMHNVERFKVSGRQRIGSLFMSHAAMVMAVGVISSLSSPIAHAQATSAGIFGQAPAGETVTVTSSENGMHRHGTVNKSGRYKIDQLRTGGYTVTLEKDGKTVDTRSNISLLVGQNAEVDFACPDDHCAAAESR